MNFRHLFDLLSERTPPLNPTSIADAELSRQIKDADLFDGKSGEMVEACRAGLLLLNDDLDVSHRIVQSPETQTNDFWHAIMHRREGDWGNARYWWNRVGRHDAMDEIFDIVIHRVPDFPLLDEMRPNGSWQPLAFNDFVRRASESGEWKTELELVQRLEMKTLLEWCAARVK